MSCTAVIERASEGPCEQCGNNRVLHCTAAPGAITACALEHHPYLGPVLARCGHEESEHKQLDDYIRCDACGSSGRRFHAYTEEL